MAYYDNGQNNGGQYGYGYSGSGLYDGDSVNGVYESPPLPFQDPEEKPSRAEKRRIRKLYNGIGGALILQYILIYVITIGAMIVFSDYITDEYNEETGNSIVNFTEAVIMFCSPALASVLMFFFYNAVKGIRPSSCFGTENVSFSFIVKAVLVTLLFHGIGLILEYIVAFGLTAADLDIPSLNYEIADDAPTFLCDIFSSVILAPVAEELLFRGIVLKEAAKVSGRFAIVFSAVIFGLMHGNPYQAVMATLVGLVFGYVTIRSKSVIPSICCHIAINLCASLPDIVGKFYETLIDPVYGIVTLVEFSAGIMGFLYVLKTDGIKLPPYTKYHRRRTLPIMLTSVPVIIILIIYIAEIIKGIRPAEHTEEFIETAARLIY